MLKQIPKKENKPVTGTGGPGGKLLPDSSPMSATLEKAAQIAVNAVLKLYPGSLVKSSIKDDKVEVELAAASVPVYIGYTGGESGKIKEAVEAGLAAEGIATAPQGEHPFGKVKAYAVVPGELKGEHGGGKAWFSKCEISFA